MKLILLITFIIITICNDIIYGQQYKSGLSINQKDSLIALIKKQELKEVSPFCLASYKLVDSQTGIINIYNMELKNIENFDYSKELLPYLQLFSFFTEKNKYILFKKDESSKPIFAIVDNDGSLTPFVMIGKENMFDLDGLRILLSVIDINHDVIFRLGFLNHLFVMKNNEIYIFVDGKLEQAIPYFKKKYTIEEFRGKFSWKTQCKDLMPGISVTPEEISKKKIIR